MDNWPYEQPIYQQLRPARRPNRPRNQSDAFIPRLAPNGQTVMVDENGQLMMPVVDGYGRPARANSVSGQRPAQIIINNDNNNRNEDNERPMSAHGYYNYEGRMERRPSNRSNRSGSVHRRRPSRSPEIYDDYDYEIDDRRRVVRYHPDSLRRNSQNRRSKEDEEKIRELEEKERELKELREKEKEKERKKKIEEELLLQELEKERKRKLREEEDKKLKDKTIEEFREKERKDREKKQKEREQQEQEFIELLRTEGYTEAEAKKKLKRMEKRKEKGITKEDEDAGEGDLRLMKPKPTYIKVHSKYISPDTLDVFQLPWEYDDRDAGYIIIKKWIGERDQEILLNHTKQMSDKARLTYSREALKEDHSRLVIAAAKPRKKSPIKRTSWFLT